ncbi:MAG: helix-turn-helix domain-containing protein, partial [Defluviitaleaceae bacterium]|nr:helix-turn-helix domain-containing protein [Defluviitaleaceae bacterium]
MNPLGLMESEIFRIVRKTQGITQQAVADAINNHVPKISLIENGKLSFRPSEIKSVKKVLNIEGMPTTHEERLVFVEQILAWRDKLPTLSNEEVEA